MDEFEFVEEEEERLVEGSRKTRDPSVDGARREVADG